MTLEDYFDFFVKLLFITVNIEGYEFTILGLFIYVFLIGLLCLIVGGILE